MSWWAAIEIVIAFIIGGGIGFIISAILTVASINDRVEDEVNDYLQNKPHYLAEMTDEEIDQVVENYFSNTPKEKLYATFAKAGFFEEFKDHPEQIKWETFNYAKEEKQN